MDRAPFQANCMQFDRVLTSEQQAQLIRIPTEEEIKQALFDIGDLKAPRPDGYSSKFYKQAWDIIKHDFVTAILDFFFQMGSFLNRGTIP